MEPEVTGVRHLYVSWASSICGPKNRSEVAVISNKGLLLYMYEISQFAR
jgi:hypothetical protein